MSGGTIIVMKELLLLGTARTNNIVKTPYVKISVEMVFVNQK